MKDESAAIIGIVLFSVGTIILVYNAVRYLTGWTNLPKASSGMGAAFIVVGMLLANKSRLSAKKKK